MSDGSEAERSDGGVGRKKKHTREMKSSFLRGQIGAMPQRASSAVSNGPAADLEGCFSSRSFLRKENLEWTEEAVCEENQREVRSICDFPSC